MMRHALWWAAAFLASFTAMAIVDQLQGSDPDTAQTELPAARAFDGGIDLVVETTDADGTAGRASEIVNSPGVTVETDAPATASTPAAFSLVATANGPSVIARVEPSADAAVLGQFANPVVSGAPLVFQVERSGTTASADWIEVKLPIRPNGTTGWIPRADVDLVDNPYRVEIDRSTYILRVFNRNEMFVETTIAIGNGDTPTPVGDFYLTELLAPPDPGGVYGPFAFGLSGFSETLANFGGADEAIIGLHGTNDPSSLGNDVSHGCVRIANDVITELAETLPLGTPVLIT